MFAATPPTGGLSSLDYGVIGLYLVMTLGIALGIAVRQRSTEDFFVGDRRLPAWAVGVSMFASLLSTITYLGMPGEMFRTGVAFLTRQLPIPLVLAVVWFVLLPFFMRLRLTSAYEYLERRFNYNVRALAAVFCLLLLFGWISVVVLTASMAISEITSLGLRFGPVSDPVDGGMYVIIASIGLFTVFYTTLGGIKAVIWTDVIQFFVLMIGAVFTIGTVAVMTGSNIGDWLAASQTYKYEAVQWFDWDVTNRSTVFTISLGMFAWFVCTHGANQVALQRYFSVKNVGAARSTYLVSAVASIGIGMLLACVGIALMYFLQSHELPVRAELLASEVGARGDLPDRVFPQFISLYLPAGLKGLVVSALFAAAMSTIDSGSNSASTIVTVDFLRPFARTPLTAKQELSRARLLTATAGLLVVVYTIGLYHVSKGTNIIDLCQKGFNCFLGPLGALFILGMFSRRATARSVIPAFILGEIFGVGSSYCQELTAWAANDFGGWFAANLGGATATVDGQAVYLGIPFSTHLVVFGSWAVTILTANVCILLLGTRASEEQQQYMWGPVVRQNELPAAAAVETE